MDREVTLQYRDLQATIACKGAELLSLRKAGKEYVFQGDPTVWKGRCPLLFPVCGGLIDDTYYHEGAAYPLEKHGFARFKDFEVAEKAESKVTFVLHEDEESKKAFPFSFRLLVRFELVETGLHVEYEVINDDSSTFFFTIGAHEGYALSKPLESYSVVFEEKEALVSSVLEGKLLGHQKLDLSSFGSRLPMKEDYFAVDALVFENIASRRVHLVDDENRVVLSVAFPTAKHLLLWTKPGGHYLCIEPWCAVPDYVDAPKDISKKPDVVALAPNGHYVFPHDIEVA